MGRLEHLRKSLTDMSHDELMEKVREVRRDRKIVRNPVKQKAEKTAAKKGSEKIKKLLAALSPAEAAALLGELEGGT